MSEKNGISFPPPRKIDPYYDRMIDLYKEKVASLEKDNERLRKRLAKCSGCGTTKEQCDTYKRNGAVACCLDCNHVLESEVTVGNEKQEYSTHTITCNLDTGLPKPTQMDRIENELYEIRRTLKSFESTVTKSFESTVTWCFGIAIVILLLIGMIL